MGIRIQAAETIPIHEVGIPTVTLEAGSTVGLEAGTIVNLGPTPAYDFYIGSQINLLGEVTPITVIGTNLNVAVGPSNIAIPWNVGTAPVFPSGNDPITVTSTSVNDTAAGTGARLVGFLGLDINGDEILEVVALDGLSIVTTIQDFFRINATQILTAGTTGTTEGVLTVQINAQTVAQVDAGKSSSFQGMVSVPNGQELTIVSPFISVSKNDDARLFINARFVTMDGFIFDRLGPFIEVFQDSRWVNYPFTLSASAGVDVFPEVENLGTSATSITGGYYGILTVLADIGV